MKVAEYRDIKDEPRSKVTVLDTARGDLNREYRLIHRSPGWEPAGSMARLRESECWAVQFTLDGASHGQAFATLAEARELFTRWTGKGDR